MISVKTFQTHTGVKPIGKTYSEIYSESTGDEYKGVWQDDILSNF